MSDLKTFQEQIEIYRKSASTRHSQLELAEAINLHKDELSKRLNAYKNPQGRVRPLACPYVQAIVRVLASWGAIGTQDQAKELLDLMECPHFSFNDWKVHPLSLLRAAPVPPMFSQSRAASTDSQRFDSSENKRPSSERPETYISLPRNRLFQPRSDEFNRLESLLFGTETQQKSSLIGLVGLGGIGKTQLAVQIAYRYENRFPAGIFWMSGTGVDLTVWQRHLAELGFNTGYLPADDNISDPENESRRARHIGHYLANHPDALLILDNVEEPNLIISALPPLAGRELACTILYTSRMRTAPPGGAICTVETLSKEEAFRLLLEATRPSLLPLVLAGSTDAEAEAVRTLCQRVGYLPLALVHLHKLLAQDQQMKLVQLSEARTKHGTLNIATRPYGDAEPLFAIFWLSWEKVHTDEARKLFKLASFFPEAESIPLWLLGLMAGLGESSDSFGPLGEARMELQELSLVEEALTGDRVRLHPLVREFGQSVVEDKNTLLTEVGQRLAAEFTDVNRLEQRAQNEGYWKCLERVQEVAIYSQLLGLASTKIIERVGHWLARESAVLGTGELWPAKIPGLFYQQLYNRSLEEGELLLASVTPRRWVRQVGSVGAEDRSLLRELKHPDTVTCVAFFPGDRILVTGCDDGAVRVWDVPSGKELLCLNEHIGSVTSVACSRTGHKIVAGFQDRKVRVWDGDTGQLLQTFEGGRIASVGFSSDGEKVAAASVEGIAWIWDVGTGAVVWKLVEEWDPHEGYSLTDIAFSPDGEMLATISTTGWVVLWDVITGYLLTELEGCRGETASISFSSDGEFLGCGSYEGAVIWDMKTEERLEAQFYPDSVLELASGSSITKPALMLDVLGPLVVHTEDEKVEVLFIESIKSGGSVQTFYGHRDRVTSACFSNDCSLIATGSKDHTARIWSLFKGGNDAFILGISMEKVQCLTFSHNGATALVGFSDEDGIGGVFLLDITSNEILKTFDEYSVRCVAFSRDDQKVAAGGFEGANVWEVKNEELLASLSNRDWRELFQHGLVNRLCFSSDNLRIAIGCSDGTVKIWDILSNRIVADLSKHQRGVEYVQFSSDGSILVTGSYDGTVYLWDGFNYSCLAMLKNHTEDVTSMCISPDDQCVAIGTRNGTVSVWWLKSAKLQMEMKIHESEITGMSFSPSGGLLITCNRDGQVYFWAPGHLYANHPVGLYMAPYPIEAIHWQNLKHILLADRGGLQLRPHFYNLVLEGVWEEDLWNFNYPEL